MEPKTITRTAFLLSGRLRITEGERRDDGDKSQQRRRQEFASGSGGGASLSPIVRGLETADENSPLHMEISPLTPASVDSNPCEVAVSTKCVKSDLRHFVLKDGIAQKCANGKYRPVSLALFCFCGDRVVRIDLS